MLNFQHTRIFYVCTFGRLCVRPVFRIESFNQSVIPIIVPFYGTFCVDLCLLKWMNWTKGLKSFLFWLLYAWLYGSMWLPFERVINSGKRLFAQFYFILLLFGYFVFRNWFFSKHKPDKYVNNETASHNYDECQWNKITLQH